MTANLDSLAPYCGAEACGGLPWATVAEAMFVDSGSYVDVVRLRCADSTIVYFTSDGYANGVWNDLCWDCASGCANCPVGATCSTIAGATGSDCRAFRCPAGYQIHYSGDYYYPICKRALPAAPSTTAATEHSHLPKLTWSAVDSVAEYRIYRRTESGSWELAFTLESYFYVDGSTEVEGSPLTSPPSGLWAGYKATSVDVYGVESAAGTSHYWTRIEI